MSVICPNKSSKEWRQLQQLVGREKAMELYIRNGYEVPSLSDMNQLEITDISGGQFKANKTQQLLRDNPKVALKIVSKLKELYPKVRVSLGGLLTQEGKWREIPAGTMGMHYRNAFQSAVAWSNDAYIETPPHEYAHDYLDMFRDHPLVQEGIKTYGEENLTIHMGQYFAGKEMSTAFGKFVSSFWDMVRSLFGHTSVADELASAFYKGKRLAPNEHAGTGIYRFQEKGKAERRVRGVFNAEGLEGELKDAQVLTTRQAKAKLAQEIGMDMTKPDFVPGAHQVTVTINKLFNTLLKYDTNEKTKRYRNTAALDQRLIADAVRNLATASAADNIGKALFDDKVELTEDEKVIMDMAVKAIQRLEYIQLFDSSLVAEDGKLVSMESMIGKWTEEIEQTNSRKEHLYKKIKNKKFRTFLQGFEKNILRYQLSPRLDAKYISGSENSWISQVFYKSLNHAHTRYVDILDKFNDFVLIPKGEHNRWSDFNQPKQNIDYYDTLELDGTVNENTAKIKLTKAEALTLYLNLRQNDKSAGNPPPGEAIRNKGFFVDEEIEGRDLKITDLVKLNPESTQRLIMQVEADIKMQELIGKIDQALDYMYDEVNNTYAIENGMRLPKVENYFPVYTGVKNLDITQQKNSIQEFRAGHARLGEDKPLRIADVNKVLNFHKNNGALYASHSLAISNNRKMLDELRAKYYNTTTGTYLDKMDGVLNNLEDNSLLYSNQGEKAFDQAANKLTNNFAVAVLGMNIGTMLKQPVAYLAAKEEIDYKYLKAAGFGAFGLVGVRVKDIFKSLKYTGVKGGETALPIEWKTDLSDPTLQEMIKYSPKLRFRLEGGVTRETGEVMMDQSRGSDKVMMPWKDKNGDPVYISKSRAMEGIKQFDLITMKAIWNAVKMETSEIYPDLKEENSDYWDHVAIRTEEIVTKTQSSFEPINRTELSRMKGAFPRLLTMFGSSTSLLGQLMVDGTISYINNPTPENRKKLFKRYVNLAFTTSLVMSTIDIMKHALTHGFDDDDDIAEMYMADSLMGAFGNFYGFSQLSRMIITRMDSQPWMASLQHPIEAMGTQFAQGLYNILRGYKLDQHGNFEEFTIDDGIMDIGKTIFQGAGLPITPFTQLADVSGL